MFYHELPTKTDLPWTLLRNTTRSAAYVQVPTNTPSGLVPVSSDISVAKISVKISTTDTVTPLLMLTNASTNTGINRSVMATQITKNLANSASFLPEK